MIRISLILCMALVSCGQKVSREMSVTAESPVQFEIITSGSSAETFKTPYYLEIYDERFEAQLKSLNSSVPIKVTVTENGKEALVSDGIKIELLVNGTYMSTSVE
ncbi:hypothetical protein [Ekhidna sp.]|uniref:hypothetical protein n=1 Tax=Ekhidna sp. TaxID=2608089 RepID=UPI003B507E43